MSSLTSLTALEELSIYMQKIVCWLMYAAALFLRSSYRFRFIGREKIDQLLAANQNYIYANWHQNLLPGILAERKEIYVTIVSKSKDAEPVAYTCRKLGHHPARGSSRRGNVDKGGRQARDEMIEYLKKGFPGAITVDGPKGPIFKVKRGVVDMALAANCWIVPYTVKSKYYIQFNSWDKFQLPYPFSKVYIHYGDVLDPKEFETVEEICDELEKRMMADTHKMRDLLGITRPI